MKPRKVARLRTNATCVCGKVCANALHLAKHHKNECPLRPDAIPPLLQPLAAVLGITSLPTGVTAEHLHRHAAEIVLGERENAKRFQEQAQTAKDRVTAIVTELTALQAIKELADNAPLVGALIDRGLVAKDVDGNLRVTDAGRATMTWRGE